MGFETLLACVILAALIFYALGGGADFGGGMWDLLAQGPRRRQQREAIAKAIAPIWEANHVWLILVLVVLFTGFPPSFGAIMTALHIPMTLILLGIVLRGSAFAFRSYDRQEETQQRRWSTLFGQASLYTPFLLGLCLGALASGEIRVTDGSVVTGFLAGWTRPFAISCGLFAQGLFAFLAATYLTVETKGKPALQDDFRVRALVSWALLVPAALVVFALARKGAPFIFEGLTSWWAPPLLVATALCAIAAFVFLLRRKFALARLAGIAQITFILIGWGVAQFPCIVVPDITFFNSSAPGSTLRLLTWALAAGVLILFPSFGYLLYVFKRPLTKDI